MKTKILFSLAVALMLTVSATFANQDDKKAEKKTLSFAIESYVDQLQTGFNEDYASILSNDVKFNLNRNGKTFSHGKTEELKDYNKKNEGLVQNCKIDYKVITSSDSYALLNVSMQFDGFTRENIVSMAKVNDSWKITEVNSVFK